MSENSAIEWTDHTFNPWMGCTKVGPGCDHCYAETLMDTRYGKVHWGVGQPRLRTAPANWRKPLAWQRNAEAFLATHGRRQRVFCASLADVFDNEIDPAWRADLFRLIQATPDLDWLLLTKRIGNATDMIAAALDAVWKAEGYRELTDFWPWPNVWLGITVVTQAEVDRDIPKLDATAAAVRFLSMEPLLERAVPSWEWLWGTGSHNGIDWVICGGESGDGARPMHPDWARAVRDACSEAGVPFLFKQWGEWAPSFDSFVERAHRWPIEPREPRGGVWSYRVGKKAAGRQLDGVEHNGFPA